MSALLHFGGWWLVTCIVAVNIWAWGRALHKARNHAPRHCAELLRARSRKSKFIHNGAPTR